MLRCVSFLPFRHGRFYRLAPEASKLQQDLCICALVLNEEAFAYAGVTTESSSRVWYTYTNFIKTVDSALEQPYHSNIIMAEYYVMNVIECQRSVNASCRRWEELCS